MTRKRFNKGLYVYTNGRDVSGAVMGWDKFLDRVATAAQKPKRQGGHNIENLNPHGRAEELNQVDPKRQCTFIATKGPRKGKRCKKWAMRGASRCHNHGGYRQNPEHPATVRRLGDVLELDRQRKARRQLDDMPAKPRAIVEQVLRDMELPRRPAVILEGVQAYLADDNGRAWRRWRKQAKAAQPSQELTARRRQTHKQ